MENYAMEHQPKIEVKEMLSSDKKFLEEAAALVSEHSWGGEYPVSPIDEIRVAEYCAGATEGDRLVGFGTVGRSFSPDALDNGELWIAHAVVDPAFRNRGIYKKLYDLRLSYALSQAGRILSCTDNPIVAEFFMKHGWKKIRETVDESGDATTVFEYSRSGSE
ncbi:MAG: GNAT family N-acetyltransferase [Patescibacteria group bacterium]|nr:GNAT family N-acetyltransferase [Patescibacteria group bacterium]